MNYIMTIKSYPDSKYEYREMYKVTEDQRRIVEMLKEKEWFGDDTIITFTSETDVIIDLTKGGNV